MTRFKTCSNWQHLRATHSIIEGCRRVPPRSASFLAGGNELDQGDTYGTVCVTFYYSVDWTFVADAARFVVNFSIPISTSTPHIYLSALPWSPHESIIASHFLPQSPRWLSICMGGESDWPAPVDLIVGHTHWVLSVGFSPDGKRVVSGSYDRTIRIWDAEIGEAVAGPLEAHADCVTSVGFAPDRKCIVSGSYDKMPFDINAILCNRIAMFEIS